MIKPYILCATVLFKDGNKHAHQPTNIDEGIVICGRRHHNCFIITNDLHDGTFIKKRFHDNIVQGFLTSDDRFVDRKEAGQIAYKAGQISKPTDCLLSEDLY